MWSANSVVINRLQAHLPASAPQVDKGALLLRLDHQLTGLIEPPRGLPPNAILIIRRLGDPLQSGGVRDHRHRTPQSTWAQCIQDQLAANYRQAHRPFAESVDANVEAVLFADQGELLAALACDLIHNAAANRWWWQTVLRRLPLSSTTALPALFVNHAVTVPAALHYLSQRGLATAVLGALSAAQAISVLTAVGQAYGINDLGARLTGASAEDQTKFRRTPLPSGDNRGAPMQAIQPALQWPADLIPFELGREQACLLGVAFTLYTRPALMRSEPFLRQLRTWWLRAEQAAVTASDDRANGSSNAPVRPSPALEEKMRSRQTTQSAGEEKTEEAVSQASETSSEQSANGASGSGSYTTQATAPGHERWQADEVPSDADEPTVTTPEGRVSHPQPLALQQQNRFVTTSTAPATHSEWRSSVDTDAPRFVSAPPEQAMPTLAEPATESAAVGDLRVWPLHGLPTELGGVLYLINLMCQLDLPDCFEVEWCLASEVGTWGVLEALARGLLTGSADVRPNDPLWAALAQLAGRTQGQLPGATLADSPGFRLPAGWLLPAAAPETCFFWAQQDGRLRLWSERGYLLLDWPYEGPVTEEQIKHELPALDENFILHAAAFGEAPLAPLGGPLVAELNPHLRRWLGWVLPYVRWRLHHMLHPSVPNATEMANDFLFSAGNLYVTATHVDLVMRLDAISIPLRLAGLDRNPGWLADFGRVVLFHFE